MENEIDWEQEYERQRDIDLLRFAIIERRLSKLSEIAGYLVEGIVERLGEFDLPQSDIEYILKSLPDIVQKELAKQTENE